MESAKFAPWSPQKQQLAKIKTALQRAGFKVKFKGDRLFIECDRYTVTCFYCLDFQQWRLQPYNQTVQTTVRSTLDEISSQLRR